MAEGWDLVHLHHRYPNDTYTGIGFFLFLDVDRMLPPSSYSSSSRGPRYDDELNIFGLRLAPLSLPLERRLQTMAAAFYVFIFMFSCVGTLAALYGLLFHTRHQWAAWLYLSWMVFDRNVGESGGRTIRWARTWRVWQGFRDYFPIRLIKTCELDPERSYIVGYHPHGIMAFGCFACFGTTALGVSRVFPGITWKLATLPVQFILPGQREFIASFGGISSTKSCLEGQMQ